MPPRPDYRHDFSSGSAGGWMGWMGGGGGPRALDLRDGAATVRSPWGVDINHAPPGAGYLHLLYVLFTRQTVRPDLAGANAFLDGGHSTDLRDAELTVTLRGELDAKGAECLLLIQADVPRESPAVRANFVLTGQPLRITPDWRQQTLRLAPDPDQWRCLGTRGPDADHPRYGDAPIAQVLADANVDLILVLFPLDVQPAGPIAGDKDRLRAGHDYTIDQTRLPSGHISLRDITIRYPR